MSNEETCLEKTSAIYTVVMWILQKKQNLFEIRAAVN